MRDLNVLDLHSKLRDDSETGSPSLHFTALLFTFKQRIKLLLKTNIL